MKLYRTTLSLILTIFLLVSCAEQITDPGNNSGDNKSSLAKIISPWYTWTTHTYWDPLYQKWFTRCTPTYSFTYSIYNFNLSYSNEYIGDDTFNNYITVNVNGTYYTTIIWQNNGSIPNPNDPIVVSSNYFIVGGQKMKLNFHMHEFYIPMNIISEPEKVRVMLVDGR